MIALVLLGIAVFCCFSWATPFLWKYGKAFAALRKLKGPREYFLGGIFNIMEMSNVQKTQQVVHDWAGEFGKIFKISSFPVPIVALNSPEYVQKLFGSKDNDHLIKPFFYDPLRPLLRNGLFTSSGDHWRSHRQPMSYINSFQHLQSYMNIFNKESHRLVNDLENLFEEQGKRKEAEVLHVLTKSTLFTITEALFNKSLNEEDENVVEEVLQGLDRYKTTRDQRLDQPWLILDRVFRMSPLSLEVDEITSKLQAFYRNVIADFKMEMLGDPGLETTSRPLVGQMLQFSDEGMLDEVLTMTMAGYETTGMTLQLLLFFLALHPEHQEKCREEVDALLNDPVQCRHGFITQQDLSCLKHLERCLMETLRFFPPVYSVLRHIQANLKLDDDLTLLPGTQVAVFLRELHMNPEIFPKPEVFDPDRFLAEECKKRHPCAYFPFAGGPRKCIGFKFATLQIVVACARILHNFLVTSSFKYDDVKLIVGVKITLDKNIPFYLQRR